MPSFFEVQPGHLVNLDLVESLIVRWNEVLFVYKDGTEQIIPLRDHTTPEWAPYEVGKRLRALATHA